MSYKRDFEEAMYSLKNDVQTVQGELIDILDMDNIEDMKIAISDAIQTVTTLLEEL